MKKSTLKRLVQLLDDEVGNLKSQIEDQECELNDLNQALDQKIDAMNNLYDQIEEYRTRQRSRFELLEAIETLMLPEKENSKIYNIKAVLCITGMGLKESKEFVEDMFERRRIQRDEANRPPVAYAT